jgi:hypothetical protein
MNKRILILAGSSRCGTTITRSVISSGASAWMTNELRIFYDQLHISMFSKSNPPTSVKLLLAETAEEYFRTLKENAIKGEGLPYRRLPPRYHFEKFFSGCMKNLKKDDLHGRIDAVLEAIFGKYPYSIVGDKCASPTILKLMKQNGIDFKLIIIHRDGRDVASSGIRHKFKDRVAPWSLDPTENADHWAENFEDLFNVVETCEIPHLLLRFEDYKTDPDKNFGLICKYLGVYDLKRRLIDPNTTHVGYYKEWIPNWEDVFSEKSKSMLKRLGYI